MENYAVYKHISPSKKVYIGITRQYPVEKRWGKNGIKYLNKNKKGEYVHRYFVNAILKYGWNNIEHIVMYTNLTKENAENTEKSLIAFYKDKNLSYNITEGGFYG